MTAAKEGEGGEGESEGREGGGGEKRNATRVCTGRRRRACSAAQKCECVSEGHWGRWCVRHHGNAALPPPPGHAQHKTTQAQVRLSDLTLRQPHSLRAPAPVTVITGYACMASLLVVAPNHGAAALCTRRTACQPVMLPCRCTKKENRLSGKQRPSLDVRSTSSIGFILHSRPSLQYYPRCLYYSSYAFWVRHPMPMSKEEEEEEGEEKSRV